MIFFKKKPHRIRVLLRDEFKLRLGEWQMDERLCAMAAKKLAEPDMRLILAVLRNERPSNHVLPLGASMDDRVVFQARAEGYEMALANLEAMTRNTLAVPMPDAVFESEYEKA
jgi:hypothetical protein